MRNALKERNVSKVYHFTRIENLNSIIVNGILCREEIERWSLDYIYNDDYRYDGYLDAICCSVSFPNYRMFYSLRNRYPAAEWAVIEIDSSVLVDKICAFCRTNAASNTEINIPLEDKCNEGAFRRMFAENASYTRRKSGIPLEYTTDPQAEVLVFETIETEYINRIIFHSYNAANRYRQLMNCRINFEADKKYFAPRMDWAFW